MLSAIFYGLRISLAVGAISTVLALVIGLAVGLTAAYFGGRLETLIMRIVDIQLSFPAILIALILIAVLGQGTGKVITALVTVQWAYYARTVRSAALVEKRKEYIEAARCLALSPARIVFRHLLPNCLPPMIVVATVQVAAAIALEATLSFLGLGLPITEPSLGLLIANGYQYLLSGKYWISFFPGLALLLHDRQHQSRRRPVARRAQSAAAAMSDAGRSSRRGAAHAFLHQGGRRQGGRRRLVHGRPRRSARPRRRIGLGQVDDRLFDHGPDRSAGPHRRRAASVLNGVDLRALPAEGLRRIRGNRIAMIFQDPMMTLNPVLRIDVQMIEAILAHEKVSPRRGARARARRAGAGRHSVARRAARRLSAPVLRRHAPARRDRDRAAEPARPHHRRRADDGARRDDPGPDPLRDAEADARNRHGADLDHARPLGRSPGSPIASA